MRAYSLDLRERVVAAYEKSEQTIAEIAARFSVGETFLKKMLRQKRQTGSLERLPTRAGAKRALSDEQRKWLCKQIKEQPDATLNELKQSLASKKKASVSLATVCRELKELGLPRKKSRLSQPKETGGNAPGIGGE
jgi:transposase